VWHEQHWLYSVTLRGFAHLFPVHAIPLLNLIRSSYTLRCRGCFFHFDHFTDGRTPWTSDQLVVRPLSKHRTTQTQNKHIHSLYGIRTHDTGFRASEDILCLRSLGYRDRHGFFKIFKIATNINESHWFQASRSRLYSRWRQDFPILIISWGHFGG
jgi:hypothetical protein